MSELATKDDLGCAYWMLFLMIFLTVGLVVLVDRKHKKLTAGLERRIAVLEQTCK